MSEKLTLGFQTIQKLPVERQDEVGQWLLDIAEQEASNVYLSREQVADLRHRVAHPEPPVSEAETEAFFRTIT